jgi:hypothetical protein
VVATAEGAEEERCRDARRESGAVEGSRNQVQVVKSAMSFIGHFPFIISHFPSGIVRVIKRIEPRHLLKWKMIDGK